MLKEQNQTDHESLINFRIRKILKKMSAIHI